MKKKTATPPAKPVTSLADLTPDPQNARKHNPRNIGQVQNSLQKYGAARSIVIDENNQIIAGHGVVEAAGLAGIERVQVVEADGETIIAVRRSGLTHKQKVELGIADNRGAELAGWNTDVLKGWAGSEIDLSQFWGKDELAELLGKDVGSEKVDPGVDLSRADELQAKWGTALGQLWEIGAHRLLCGDCTVRENVERVMGGEKIQAIVTDPPYGVEYVGKTKDALTIQNDGRDTLFSLLYAWLVVAKRHMDEGAAFYIAAPPGPQSYEFSSAIVKAGLNWRQTLVWLKDALVLGHSDYHYKHEIIFYGSNGRKAKFYGDRKNVSVVSGTSEQPFRMLEDGVLQVQIGTDVYIIRGQNLEVDMVWPDVVSVPRPKASTLHPTMKPVELMALFIKNSTLEGGVCYEPFAGSGTTLVACEQLGRRGRGIELSPAYVAVTLERLAGLGLTPKLVTP